MCVVFTVKLCHDFTIGSSCKSREINCIFQGGQLIWLRGNFEKAAFSGGPYLLMEREASIG